MTSYSLSKTITCLACWTPALLACTSFRCPRSVRFGIEWWLNIPSWLLRSGRWACSLRSRSCCQVLLSSRLPLSCTRFAPLVVFLSSQHCPWSSLPIFTAQLFGISTFPVFRFLSWFRLWVFWSLPAHCWWSFGCCQWICWSGQGTYRHLHHLHLQEVSQFCPGDLVPLRPRSSCWVLLRFPSKLCWSCW